MLSLQVGEEVQKFRLSQMSQYLKILSIEMNTFQKCLKTMYT